jgi:hypothetical protein
MSVPGAISSLVVNPGNGQATASFPPASGATGYKYSIDNGVTWVIGTSSPITIPGLSNGVEYIVRVRGTNANGDGTQSPAVSVTPSLSPPGIPTITSITPGPTQLAVNFTAGTGTVTGYQYSLDNGATWAPAGGAAATSPITITGLTNGTLYTVRIRALNGGTASPGIYSTGTVATPSANPPGLPTITSIVPSSTTLSVNFTAPTSGATPTTYQYFLDSVGAWYTRASGTIASPLIITTTNGTTPLSNGTAYSVRIRALNGGTVSPGEQTAIVSATPSTAPPGAPTINTITPASGQLTVNFTAGTGTNTGYQYSLNQGATWITQSATASSMIIPSLINGTAYSVRIRGFNGTAAASPGVQSAAVSATPSTSVPGVPTINSVTGGPGQLSVAFSPPPSGAATSTYQYSLDQGATWYRRTSGTTVSPFVITDISAGSPILSPGTMYSVRIRALAGTNPGVQSNALTGTPTLGVPSAPTITSITPTTISSSSGTLTVAFTAGAGAGAIAATNYQYSTDNGTVWTARSPDSTTSPFDITSVNPAVYNRVILRAVNATGNGTSSVMVGPPSAPSNVVITPDNGQLSVAFTFAIGPTTNYQYSLDGGAWTTRSDGRNSTPLIISGLTNNQQYSVRLRAINNSIVGFASTAVSATPSVPPAPSAPPSVGVNPSINTMSVVFTAPSEPVTNYDYSLDKGTTWITRSPAANTSPISITDLSNTTPYAVQIRAFNNSGTGTASSIVYPPSAPTIASIIPGDTFLDVSFNAASVYSGGNAITNYQYTLNNGTTWITRSPSSTASPLRITGLTNGTSYNVRLRGLNGSSGFLSDSASSTPLGLLTGVSSAVRDYNGTFRLIYTLTASTALPTTSGGYTVDISGGGAATFAFEAPNTIIVSGLQEYTDYSFLITANNCSNTLRTVTAKTLDITEPGVVTDASCNVGSSQLTLNWRNVSVLGGSPITYYVFDSPTETNTANALNSPGQAAGSGPYTYTITGLTNRTAYSYYVRAIDADGNVGTAVTISGTTLGPTLSTPVSAPVSDVTASSLTVNWNAVSGTDVTYSVTMYDNGGRTGTPIGQDTSVSGTSKTFTGLSPSTTYYFNIVAQGDNYVSSTAALISGTTLAGTAYTSNLMSDLTTGSITTSSFKSSLTATIASLTAPISVAATGMDVSKLASSTLNGYTLPTEVGVNVFLIKDGESYTLPPEFDTTKYVYMPSSAGSSYTIGGVTFAFDANENPTIGGVPKSLGDTFTVGGQKYLYVFKGTVGGVPITAPGAPTIASVTGGNKQLTVVFTAPVSNGGAIITNYQYSTDGGLTWTARNPANTSTTLVIAGLADDTPYQVQLRAVNAAGAGTATSSTSGTTSAASGGGGGGNEVVPCFFGNARVLTSSGYRRMDSLAEGDMVMTPAGVPVAIERVKKYVVAAGPSTNPYVIPAGVFGAERRVLISPDHKVCLADGRKVEAKRLGLAQEDREGMLTYYNLELTGEADMVVSGVPVESLAHVRRVVVTMDQFVGLMAKKYGAAALSPDILANMKRTCRRLADGRIEIPVVAKHHKSA